MSRLKRFARCAMLVFLMLFGSLTAAAADGNVSYSGDAGKFVFQPGSEHSVTDLFPDFKGVMPGDTLTQNILVRNKASEKVRVKIYLRALGAHEHDSRTAYEKSVEFLSQLTLSVSAAKSELFSAPADQKGQLSDWVLLGEFGPGGEAELTVTLHVPTTLDNAFMNAVGYLDWQFMVEEFPADLPDDPSKPHDPSKPQDPDKPYDPNDPGKPADPDQPGEPGKPGDSEKPGKPNVPHTGDDVNVGLLAGLFLGSGLLLVILLLLLKKKKKSEE
ncbi:MAG: LPXTG cell wall anchor domain-containing protein [Oscillospiraceae bacterium]|nr:LPXTG cell wall anchor domain-containing protein [Oscillospiraceae bacterium]MBR3849076.1 LPXTG cell wall anchor domain-containing protein [Oscillospiraceae bacterium]